MWSERKKKCFCKHLWTNSNQKTSVWFWKEAHQTSNSHWSNLCKTTHSLSLISQLIKDVWPVSELTARLINRWFFPCSRPVSSSGCCWEPPSSVCCCSGWRLGLAWSPGCTWLKSATGSTARWDTSSLSCRQLVHEILTLPDKLRFAVEPRATLLIMHAGIYFYPDVFPDTGGEKWCDQLYFLLSNMCFFSS